MKTRTMLMVSLAALALAGCNHVTQADKEAALAVIRKNAELTQDEKLDEMMLTMHPQSKKFDGTRKALEELAKTTKLEITVSSLAVVVAKDDEIRVRFAQTVNRISKIPGGKSGPKTRTVGFHVLKKDGHDWKIMDTIPLATEALDAPDEDSTEPIDPAEVAEPVEAK